MTSPLPWLLLAIASTTWACSSNADEALEAPVADAGPPPSDSPGACGLSAPEILQPDALANTRCGVEGAWLTDSDIGTVSTTGDEGPRTQTAAALAAFAALGEIELPRPPTYDVEVDAVLYWTQDRGERVEASALVAYPTNYEGEPLPTLLFLHGTSGFTDGCGVSGSPEASILASYIASLGYAVVAPDYLGLKELGAPSQDLHPYLVGEPTALASLDSVRALHGLIGMEHPEMCLSQDVAFLGGSQGGHAALWVDRLAPHYAAEMNIVGGVATVPPVDLLAQSQRALTQPVPATANSVAFLGSAAFWYGLEDRLDEIFVPRSPSIPEILGSECSPGDAIKEEELSSMFVSDVLAAASTSELADYGEWGCMTVENSLNRTSIARTPHGPDSYGILYLVGGNDTLVHPPIQRESYDELCTQGVPLDYLECAEASHTDATIWALGETLDYIDDRLAGVVPERSCQRGSAITCSGTPD